VGLKPDTGYAYDKEARLLLQDGHQQCRHAVEGAKKVPKGTLFFVGHNGLLYMRTGPYLEGDGSSMFGAN